MDGDFVQEIYGLQGIEEAALSINDTVEAIVNAVDDEYPQVKMWAGILHKSLNNLILEAQDAMATDYEAEGD